MRLLYIIIIFVVSALLVNCAGDKKINTSSDGFYVASWNIENLFDTIDDAEKADEWFTPESEINWTEDKLKNKIRNLSKVISTMNRGDGPDILGIQEVEHEYLLQMIIDSLKSDKHYKIVHEESPDVRGIDNAIIYNSNIFELVQKDALTVNLEDGKTTRQIIYAELKTNNESIHVFVNHWPSRRKGLKETEGNRVKAAQTLMDKLEKIDNLRSSNVIIMGDFNDMPSNISIKKILGAKAFECNDKYSEFALLNISHKQFQKGRGTYKYKDHWNMLDQIIISNSLLDGKNMDYDCESFEILKPEFIVQKDGKFAGTSLPTYGGRKYLGGYSDHYSIGAFFKIIEN